MSTSAEDWLRSEEGQLWLESTYGSGDAVCGSISISRGLFQIKDDDDVHDPRSKCLMCTRPGDPDWDDLDPAWWHSLSCVCEQCLMLDDEME